MRNSNDPLSLRETVGQLFMVGFDGTDLSQEFMAWLKEFRPGGVILFSRNLSDPDQILALTQRLQEQAGPLIIAIDQEGGRVSRLPSQFTIFPAAARFAQHHSTTLTYEAAAITGKELRAVGINMNMAPVLDIHTRTANLVIGDRAFSSQPEQVCCYGEAVIAGLQNHGVIACGKHFPGHGDTQTDSHKELPFVEASRARLEDIELQPFRHAIKKNLASIMTAHVQYPALDPQLPATLSPAIIETLLRGHLGFDGLVLTDDMEMNAITDHFSPDEASVAALHAGVDMLVICHRQDRQTDAIEAVLHAAESGDLPVERLNRSLARVVRIKTQFLSTIPISQDQPVTDVVGAPSHQNLLRRIQAIDARI